MDAYLYVTGWQLVETLLIILAAAIFHGVTGFGFMVLASPLVSFCMDIKMAIPLLVLLGACNAYTMLIMLRKSVDWPQTYLLIPATIAGVPLGVWSMIYLNDKILRYCLASFIAIIAIKMICGKINTYLRAPAWALPFGLCAGFFSGMFNMSGPVLITYAQLRHWERDRFKGTVAVLMCMAVSTTAITQFISGITPNNIFLTVVLIYPFIYFGNRAGIWIGRFLSPHFFSKMMQWLLLLLALLLALK